MTFLIFLKKLWAALKKHWRALAAVVGAIIAFVMLRQNSVNLADQLKKSQEIHDAEVKAIDDARAAEEKQHETDVKNLQAALDAVQKQYDASEKILDDKKRAEVEDIVKQHGDDPVALAQKLSESTGLQIVLPPQQ